MLSTLACSFPIIARRFPNLPIPHRFLFLSRHFGTGVLIATAFVHLLPTAFVSLTDPCLPDFWNKGYPAMAGLIAMVAVFVVVCIEMFFATRGAGHSHGSEWDQIPDDDDDDEQQENQRPRGLGLRGGRSGPLSVPLSEYKDSPIPLHDVEAPPEPDGRGDGNGHVASPRRRGQARGQGRGQRSSQAEAAAEGDDDDDSHSISSSSSLGSDLDALDPISGSITVSESAHLSKGAGSSYSKLSRLDPSPSHGHGHAIAHSHDPSHDQDDGGAPSDRDPKTLLLQCLLLEAGILFHSIFIGLAVSVATGPAFLVLLTAISFHQTFEGFALGSRIAALIPSLFPARSPKPWLMALAYGTTTPIGQALGLWLHELYDPASMPGLLTVGITNAVSSGLLLFAGLVQLIAEDFLSERSYTVLKGRRRVEASIAVACGGVLMALVGAFA